MSESENYQTSDLLNSVNSLFSADTIQKISSSLGESTSRIRNGIGLMVPVFLATILKQFSGESGANNFIRIAKDFNLTSLIPVTAMGSTPTENQELLHQVFGNHLTNITNLLSKRSELSTTSTTSLLSMLAPIILSFIGQKAKAFGFSPTVLRDYFNQQKHSIAGALPLGFGSLIGFEPNVGAVDKDRQKWVPWLTAAAVLAVLIGGYAWLKNRMAATETVTQRKNVTEQIVGSSEQAAKEVVTTVENKWHELFTKPLGDNSGRSIAMEEVTFETGSTQITPGSITSINDLANELKANPTVRIRLDGYTDDTGSPERNQSLSLERAVAVRNILIERGVDKNQLEVKGFGANQPVASNANQQGRQLNRRLEVTILPAGGPVEAH